MEDERGGRFPKERRILRSSEFREVYDRGFKIAGQCFAVFCLKRPGGSVSRIGLTVPRALGKSVRRNRIKRRIREAARLRLDRLPPGWDVVFNPRRAALSVPFETLLGEVEKVFARCGS